MAVVAPSYDGKERGKLLTAILYDPCHCNGTYFGYVYNWEAKRSLREPLLPLFTHLNHNNSIPCDMTDILKVRNQ